MALRRGFKQGQTVLLGIIGDKGVSHDFVGRIAAKDQYASAGHGRLSTVATLTVSGVSVGSFLTRKPKSSASSSSKAASNSSSSSRYSFGRAPRVSIILATLYKISVYKFVIRLPP